MNQISLNLNDESKAVYTNLVLHDVVFRFLPL